MSLRERFRDKWLPHPKTGCWTWIASTVSGYGSIGVEGKTEKAHRVSWRLHEGKIPDGIKVLHSCDNTRCVNPDHLFLGTQKENIYDMMAKGRDRKSPRPGELNGKAKLDAIDVAYIRNSPKGPVLLGRMFGVHYRHIWAIRRRIKWH